MPWDEAANAWLEPWCDFSTPSRQRPPAVLADASADLAVLALVELLLTALRAADAAGAVNMDWILAHEPGVNSGHATYTAEFDRVTIGLNPLVAVADGVRPLNRGEMNLLRDLSYEDIGDHAQTCTVLLDTRQPEPGWRMAAVVAAVSLRDIHNVSPERVFLIEN